MKPDTTPVPAARASQVGALLVAALTGTSLSSLLMLGRMYAAAGEAPPPVIAFVALPLLAAATLRVRRRWAPVPALVVTTLIALMLLPHLPDTLRVPADALFVPFVLLTVCALTGSVLGTVATVQSFRGAPRPRGLPRWLPAPLGLVLGATGGILLMGALPGSGASSVLDDAALARLPVVEAERFEFVQQELRVRAGTTVALRLENRDGMSHSFDVDELDVHVLMPPNADAVAVFETGAPGTYTFYCAPHYDRRTGQGMKGTLVVEP